MNTSRRQIDPQSARLEREAVRRRLRRRIAALERQGAVLGASVLREELAWVLARQKRYDAAPGGLGRRR